MKFTGLTNETIEDALSKGLAKTRSEVLRLGLFELKDKYGLAEGEPTEEERTMLAKFLTALKESDYASEKELWDSLR